MEEEFGIREPPQAVTRFGLPSMLRILPPKRKKTLTQIPELRRNSSFLKGSWETVWGCDVDDVDFVESPPEDEDLPLDSVLDQDRGFDEVAAAPTNGAPWSTDGEITPMLSSNFPSTPDPNVLRRDGDVESPRTSTSRHGSAELHASQ